MIGWIDAQAGASGDMLLGALVDAGVPLPLLQDAVAFLGVTLTANPTTRASLGATKVDVLAPETHQARTWADVRDLLPEGRSHEVFERLAEAEGAVHRIPADEVHFHEVGALDALADIIGVTAGFAHLGLTELHCSTVALGSGTTRGAHGPLPVPAPAVLALLKGKPVRAGASPHEATTPTGAALLAALVTHWGPLPPMSISRTGLGAGGRDPAEVANVVRLVLGDRLQDKGSAVLIETNVDDLDPRLWPHVLAQLMAAGASDAWLTPILMKKGRPAHALSVLCPSERAQDLRSVVFRETSTIGLRESTVDKHALERRESTVDVGGHTVRVKTAVLSGEVVNTNPEWDDVLAAARALGVPAKEVLQRAKALGTDPTT